MKKKITLLALNEEIAPMFKEEMIEIFADLLEIDYVYPSDKPIQPIYDTDLILCHDPEILVKMMPYIKCDAPTLMMKRTISQEALDRLRQLKTGKKALVVSVNDYATVETLTTIYQLGVTQLLLYPFYQGMENYPKVDYVIAPRDYDFIPNRQAELIIIGKRVFDISTILDIIAFLEVNTSNAERIIARYLAKVPTYLQGIKHMLQDKRVLYATWKTLLNESGKAIIIANQNNEVIFANNKVSDLLHLPRQIIAGDKLDHIVARYPQLEILLSEESHDHELIHYKGVQLVVTIKKNEFDCIVHGKIIMISLYNDMLKIQQEIHNKIVGKGYYSKYTFENLIGCHPKLLDAVKICKNIAQSSSTVLLSGESGTGKEVFAGAIHNYSMRANKPFVAINCATLPENLLESELFGYEEGAFTGAKKGGKIGLFEMANKGTLFLDEIGEMPLSIQARFLRVLQEKEIIRVGGDSIIKVDIRIIAATNQDLWQMVTEGNFRKDLFFRLNVFQISVPPLRERLSDIPVLVEHFLQSFHSTFTIAQDFRLFWQKYDWPGNIRELQNVLEYMAATTAGELSFANLPQYLKREVLVGGLKGVNESVSREILLLKLLKQEQESGRNTGRRSLCQAFNKVYFTASEADIRDSLTLLHQNGYIMIHRGRRGCEITAEGEKLL